MSEERNEQYNDKQTTTESIEQNESLDLEASTDATAVASMDDVVVPLMERNKNDDEVIRGGTKVETFEIEMSNHNNNNFETNDTSELVIPSIMTAPSMDESIDDDIVEMESLLRTNSNNTKNGMNTSTTTNQTMKGGSESNTKSDADNHSDRRRGSRQLLSSSAHCCSYCLPSSNSTISKPYRMGNIYVLYPPIYVRTNGWLVLGPHWFGPPFIILIVTVLSYYIIYVRCYQRQWYITTTICTLLCFSTLYNLINTAYRDPGVIIKNSLPINHNDPDSIPRSYRFCDTCNYYQPSHAAHCPDCNVCVAGFDHHCVWMSICIGVGNYKPFMRFNLSWLAYVVYAVVWVAVIAPIFDE